MKKIAIFDLDGTLLNTLNSIANCINTALCDYKIQKVDINVVPQFIGHGADNLIKKVSEYVNLDPKLFKEFREHYLAIYREKGSDNITPYKNIPELLNSLKQSGIKLAILSNKPDKIVKDCVEEYFPGIFDMVCGQKEGVPVKPDTTQLFSILNAFNLQAQDCIYCGDSLVDVETGKNAKALTLGAAWGFYGDKPFTNADGILYSPEEMLKYI